MDPNKTKRVLEILDEALSLNAAERADFIRSACKNDTALEEEVLSELRFHVDETIMETPGPNSSMPSLPTNHDFSTRYELQQEIARGGGGRILRAFDREMERVVAIKILHDKHKDSPSVVRRFITEAKISGSLTHPGVPPIYEIGALPDGEPFIAMKLVHGETLAHLLKARSPDQTELERFLNFFERICQTIAFAHATGVIHRDLKPENIMVSRFAEVQVMDWGLAKTLGKTKDDGTDETTGGGITTSTETETLLGSVMGTPAYMAPEQICGERDQRTDVFALGGILCEILTGQPPFNASSTSVLLKKVSEGNIEEAHARLRKCGADDSLVDLAIACLDPEPENRPRDAGVLAARITEYIESTQKRLREAELEEHRSRAVAEETRKRARVRWVATVLGFTVIIAILGSFVINSQQQAQFAQRVSTIETEEREAAEDVSYWATMLAAFREFKTGNNFEANRILEASPARLRNWEWHHLRNTINAHEWEMEFPDKHIKIAAFLDGGPELALVDETGVTHITDIRTNRVLSIIRGPSGLPLAGSADGHFVLSKPIASEAEIVGEPQAVQKLVLWRTTTGQPVQEFDSYPFPSVREHSRHTKISPYGRYVACTSPDNSDTVTMYDAASGKRLRVFANGNRDALFSPDGKWFVYCERGSGLTRFWDLANARDVGISIASDPRTLKLSRDGSRLACVRHDGIQFWDLTHNTFVIAEMDVIRYAGGFCSFSKVGKEFVAVFNNDSIHVWSTETGALLRQIGFHGDVNAGILTTHSWHNGLLALTSVENADSRVRLWDVEKEPSRALSGHTSFVYPVVISSDGKRIVSGAWDNTVKIWDVRTGTVLFNCEGHQSFIYDLDVDDANSRIVSVDAKSNFLLWDTTTSQRLVTRSFPAEKQVDDLAKYVFFSLDGRSIIGNSDTHLLFLDPSTLEIQRSFELEMILGGTNFNNLQLAPSEHYLAMCGSTNGSVTAEVKILNIGTLDEIQTIILKGVPKHLEFSPDESLLAVGFTDGFVETWNLKDPEKPLWRERLHQKEVYALKFTPDGSRLFSGGSDASIRVWDPISGTSFGPLRGHSNYVYSLDISGDGTRLVSGSGDSTVRIWDAVR